MCIRDSYYYYDTIREKMKQIRTDAGERFKELDGRTKQKILGIVSSMKTKKGVRVQENAILTVLRKSGQTSK